MESWASNGDILVSESYELIDCGDNKRSTDWFSCFPCRLCLTTKTILLI
jgi:hypothetical protein